MREVLSGCCLRAVTSVLPASQQSLEALFPTQEAIYMERFRSLVGIHALHRAAPHQKASDFALAAAQHLFAQRPEIEGSTIDALLFLSQTPDALAPITASRLLRALGLSERVLALDVNQGCTGFVAGLLLAANLLQNPAFRNVLIVGGDTLTHHLDVKDAGAAMLFSDGGFAAVVGRDGNATWTFETLHVPSEAIRLPYQGPLQMMGSEVFNFTLLRVAEQLQALPRADYYLLGQSNAFALQQIARTLGCDASSLPCRIAQRGNTSGASLPTLLCDLVAEGFEGVHEVILSAFGVGLSAMSLHLPFDTRTVVPLAHLTPEGGLQ